MINRFAILLVVTKLGEQDCNGEKKNWVVLSGCRFGRWDITFRGGKPMINQPRFINPGLTLYEFPLYETPQKGYLRVMDQHLRIPHLLTGAFYARNFRE